MPGNRLKHPSECTILKVVLKTVPGGHDLGTVPLVLTQLILLLHPSFSQGKHCTWLWIIWNIVSPRIAMPTWCNRWSVSRACHPCGCHTGMTWCPTLVSHCCQCSPDLHHSWTGFEQILQNPCLFRWTNYYEFLFVDQMEIFYYSFYIQFFS